MRRILFPAAVLTLTALSLTASGQDKGNQDPILAAMMKKKLTSAHLVLDGVALGDFKKMANGGEELIGLAKSETWQLIRSPDYEMHSRNFIRAAEKLVKKAKEQNMDGAALAYVEMTLSCVQCHQYVREHRRDVRLDPNALRHFVLAVR